MECHCPCHTSGARHIVPCCTKCPQCLRNIIDIQRHMVDRHDILVGMTIEQAQSALYNVRAVKIDGVSQTITLSSDIWRANVEVVNGKISKFCSWG